MWLIDSGEDVNMQLTYKEYSNALVAATTTPHIDNLKSLIETGADGNQQVNHKDYGSALAASSSVAMASVLLGADAEVNIEIQAGS
jgi:hypothetical protein